MATVKNVFDYLCEVAPIEIKSERDNIGFLVGRSDTDVSKIILALDITSDVISEAKSSDANLIVSHHPLFFSLSNITDSDVTGKKILKLIENGISAICMHTNLDAALSGVNYVLADIAGIADSKPINENNQTSDGEFSCGRFGFLKMPCNMSEYLKNLKTSLKTDGLRYYDAGRDVHKVAVAGGSGSAEFKSIIEKGCDTFVTADIKYHLFLEAKELGINLIDGGHFCTENVIIPPLADKLRTKFPQIDVFVSENHKQTVKFG